jgi:hypothetical protein
MAAVVSSKAHRGKGRRGRVDEDPAPGPPGRKPVAPPGKVEKPARSYDRRDERHDVDEQTGEEKS